MHLLSPPLPPPLSVVHVVRPTHHHRTVEFEPTKPDRSRTITHMHGAGGWYTSMRVYDVSVAHTFTYPHWAISP